MPNGPNVTSDTRRQRIVHDLIDKDEIRINPSKLEIELRDFEEALRVPRWSDVAQPLIGGIAAALLALNLYNDSFHFLLVGFACLLAAVLCVLATQNAITWYRNREKSNITAKDVLSEIIRSN